jgi:cysteine desulfuration protein SufE
MKSLTLSLEEVIENFEFLDDWEDRYRYLIDLGKGLPSLDDQYKTETYRVRGCTSQVWLTSSIDQHEQGTRIIYQADSDAHIVRGLVALVLITFSQQSPEAILNIDIEEVFKQLGLEKHLSFNRRNGFFSMVEQVKILAKRALV